MGIPKVFFELVAITLRILYETGSIDDPSA